MSPATLHAPANTPHTYTTYTLGRGGGTEALRLEERRTRPLASDEVRVRIRAVALNHRDLMFADGRAGAAGQTIVPASDAAGEVLEVGPAVHGLRPGDTVISSFFPDWQAGPASPEALAGALGGSLDGVLAEQRVLPASAWVRAPANLTAIEAATLPCAGLTAWHALFGIDPLPPGATVALLGTGGVSVWALQLAKAAGLRAFVTSSDDGKLARVRELGADATINYRQHPQWGARLRDLAGGQGVARILDVGGHDTLAQSIDALQTGGSVAVIGRLAGAEPARVDPAALFLGGKRLVGLMVGSRAMAQDLVRFVEQADIHPVIDRVFPYSDAEAAYRHLAASRHIGKVVIRVD